MNVRVVVPWRTDGAHRERAWTHVRPHIEGLGFPLLFGDAPGDWSLARSVNLLAEGDWDVLVMWTADAIVPHAAVLEAVSRAPEEGMVLAFNRTVKLDRKGTRAYLAGRGVIEKYVRGRRPSRPGARIPVGGVHATPRWLWDRVRGYDPRFVGWGAEDTAYHRACRTLGGVGRVDAELVSLWHPGKRRGSEPTKNLSRRYREAQGDPRKMAALIAER